MEERSNFNFLVEIISTSVGAATMCLTVFAMVIALCWWIRRYTNNIILCVCGGGGGGGRRGKY